MDGEKQQGSEADGGSGCVPLSGGLLNADVNAQCCVQCCRHCSVSLCDRVW